MSYHEMKALAVHVAVDVTNMDRENIEYMIHEFGANTVHDFFEFYERLFMADVNKQLEWIEEIVQGMD